MSAPTFLLRPSAAGKWVRCAGYATLAARFPERTGDNTVRDEGTAGHWAAYELGNGRQAPSVAPNGVELTDEIMDGVNEYLAVLASWGAPVYMESSVQAISIHPTQCGGSVDAWAWDAAKRILYVGDLKLGYRQVSAFENWQLLCYVRGVIDYLQSVHGKFTEHFTVVMVIVQPRGYGYPTVKEWRVSSEALIPYMSKLRDAASRAVLYAEQGEDGFKARGEYNVGAWGEPFTAGPHCDGCSAAGNCPTLSNAGLAVVDISGCNSGPDVTPQLAGWRLRRLMRARDTLDAEIDALTAMLEHEVGTKRTIVPFFEMGSGSSRRAWREGAEEKAVTMARMLGVDITKTKPMTPTQAVAALKYVAPGVLDQYIEQRPGKVKLRLLDENHAAKLFSE